MSYNNEVLQILVKRRIILHRHAFFFSQRIIITFKLKKKQHFTYQTRVRFLLKEVWWSVIRLLFRTSPLVWPRWYNEILPWITKLYFVADRDFIFYSYIQILDEFVAYKLMQLCYKIYFRQNKFYLTMFSLSPVGCSVFFFNIALYLCLYETKYFIFLLVIKYFFRNNLSSVSHHKVLEFLSHSKFP